MDEKEAQRRTEQQRQSLTIERYEREIARAKAIKFDLPRLPR